MPPEDEVASESLQFVKPDKFKLNTSLYIPSQTGRKDCPEKNLVVLVHFVE